MGGHHETDCDRVYARTRDPRMRIHAGIADRERGSYGGVGQGEAFGIAAPEEACPRALSQPCSPLTRIHTASGVGCHRSLR